MDCSNKILCSNLVFVSLSFCGLFILSWK